MHTVATYPLLQTSPLAVRRGGWLAYVRGLSFVFCMFSLQWPFWYIREWGSWAEPPSFKYYYLTGFLVCFAAHLTLGIGAWIRGIFSVMSTWSGKLITAFCAVALIASPLSLAPVISAYYAIITWGIYLLLHMFWKNDYRVAQRAVVLTGFVLFAWLVLLAVVLGIRWGYGVGAIPRNNTGQAAFTAMACCLLSPKRSVRWLAIAAAVGIALSVNSRGTLLAMVVFFAAYYAVYYGSLRFIVYGLAALLVFIGLMLISPDVSSLVGNKVLRLHEQGRGLGSGMTGRWETFVNGIAAFWKVPILGCGFRAAIEVGYSGSHSGLIRLFVETGFVGGFLMMAAMFLEFWRRFRFTQRFRNLQARAAPGIDVAETLRVNVVAFAVLCTTLTFWVYEPLYINLGATSSLIFWLMMVSPVYITPQGVTIQR